MHLGESKSEGKKGKILRFMTIFKCIFTATIKADGMCIDLDCFLSNNLSWKLLRKLITMWLCGYFCVAGLDRVTL